MQNNLLLIYRIVNRLFIVSGYIWLFCIFLRIVWTVFELDYYDTLNKVDIINSMLFVIYALLDERLEKKLNQ